MQKNNTIIAAVVVVIVIIAAVGVYYGMNNGGGDNTQNDEGDTYYFYLDGMGELNGWYTGTGMNGEDALKSALDSADIIYDISSGSINHIGDYYYNVDNNFFGLYQYVSNTVDNPMATNFVIGPSINEVNGNIIYITYGPYTYDATFGLEYTPSPFTNSSIFSSGPFVDENYRPLDYDDTYYFYLDGMGELNGWYTATGANAEEALKAALDQAQIVYEISDGWISSINNLVEEGKYFGTYLYTSTNVASANAYSFATGPVLDEVVGNIVYVTFAEYQMNSNYVTVYNLNPTNTTGDMMSTGPFA